MNGWAKASSEGGYHDQVMYSRATTNFVAVFPCIAVRQSLLAS
jgi:hypothetical protein